jgi:hypothetical protein
MKKNVLLILIFSVFFFPQQASSFIRFAIRKGINHSSANWHEKDTANPDTLKLLAIVSAVFLVFIIIGLIFLIKSSQNKK